MKKLILLMLILAPVHAHAGDKEPFVNDLEVGALGVVSTMAFCALGNHAQDKSSHCYAGLVPGVWGTIFTKQAKWGFISGCGLGIAKEIRDHQGFGTADPYDAAYTCGAALVSSYFTKKIIVYQRKIDDKLAKKPNTYLGVNLSFSTGKY